MARVDETDKGWFIAWIDRSPNALAKQVSRYVISELPDFDACLGSIIEEGTCYNIRRTA